MLRLLTRAGHASTARTPRLHRSLTSRAGPTPEHSIYISNCTDPYFNLTFEDWLFRHKAPEKPLLLLYRDEPCVVVGRNQNPWKEVNIRASRRTGIPFIRRHSGGGTVYHDLGNTNFSIHLPRGSFDRHATAQVVLRAVRSLGIDANVNDRNDICVGKDKIRSAYKIVKDRAYHHGTMLISTRLDTLGELLRSGKDTMETRGVASVRSPVCNLRQHHYSVSHEDFVEAVVDAFRHEYGVHEQAHSVHSEDMREVEYVHRGMSELKTWDWTFGQTPEFTYDVERTFPWGSVTAKLRSKHGILLQCELGLAGDVDEETKSILALLVVKLERQKYGVLDEGIALLAQENERAAEVLEWLRAEMDS
ncbi:Lipoyltransferase and lipoate-protein ligase [Lentinus tigrinus ALCF2SS1-6]|uniref:Putative lipoate-protein ligase A n=1 Tax=Lentinus tigrinus ALCF2SS1-6 TaxID=1328759 RepID=A0A5C2SU74_9APHY|nr:Lipoyltransferase and lipoate-protein ligase [Lentinus tigrinus ALCF2SS1-6]